VESPVFDDPTPQPVEGTPKELPAPFDAEDFTRPCPLCISPIDDTETPALTVIFDKEDPLASVGARFPPEDSLTEPDAAEPVGVKGRLMLTVAVEEEETASCPAAVPA